MTIFIFMLTRDPRESVVDKVLTELKAAFPQHDFLAGDPDMNGYENSILAIHESAGGGDEPGVVVLPDADELADVAAAFADILTSLRSWKPS